MKLSKWKLTDVRCIVVINLSASLKSSEIVDGDSLKEESNRGTMNYNEKILFFDKIIHNQCVIRFLGLIV